MTIPEPAPPPAASLLELLSTRRASLLILLVWAAIYVPTLGSLEIKGEEGRRLLPAVAMLQTGNWVVPSIGGVDYLSKPPLINWLAAAAFKITGTRSEWAARAPSTLVVLVLALATVWSLSGALTPAGALTAAVFTLTNLGFMEKGRLAEIEALYISLFGLALLAWLSGWWSGSASPWRTWTLPGVFLGLGLLTKGPLHIVFFYTIIVAVLAHARRLRDLWNIQHLIGVILALVIFAAWAYPYLHQTANGRVGTVWRAQLQGRLEISESFHLVNWLLNIPRGLANYVPWIVFVPLLWWKRSTAVPDASRAAPIAAGGPPPERTRAVLRGGRLAVSGCFLAICLAPGGLPRYTLPLVVPLSIVLALVFVRQPERVPPLVLTIWSRIIVPLLALLSLAALPAAMVGGAQPWQWLVALAVLGLGTFALIEHCRFRSWGGAPVLALSSAGVMALVTADYSLGAVPHMRHAENVRPLAQKINRITDDTRESVHVLTPGFLPFLYYLRPDPIYVLGPDAIPSGRHYLLVREGDFAPIAKTLKDGHRPQQTLRRMDDKNRGHWYLLRVETVAKASL